MIKYLGGYHNVTKVLKMCISEKNAKKLLHFGNVCGSINKLSGRTECAPLAQLDRASGYGPEGRGFESLRAYQNR